MPPKASPTDYAAYEKEFYDACDNADGDKIMSFLGHAKLSSETLCKGFESAAIRESPGMVRALSAAGVDMAPGALGFEAACKNGDLPKVRQALASKKLSAETLKDGLYSATSNGHRDIVDALFKARVRMTPQSISALSALQDPHMIRLYFARGLKPSKCKTRRGEPLLRLVNAACAREFLERGVDPNRCGPKKIPPLASALDEAYEDGGALFDLLVEYGAKVDGGLFFNAISWSMSNTEFKTRFLLGKGLNPNATDAYWGTPLHCAIRFGMVEVVQILLDGGADPTARVKCKCFDDESPVEAAQSLMEWDPHRRDLLKQVLKLLTDAQAGRKTSTTASPDQSADGSELEQTKVNGKRVHALNLVATEPTAKRLKASKQHTVPQHTPKKEVSMDHISSRTRSRTKFVS